MNKIKRFISILIILTYLANVWAEASALSRDLGFSVSGVSSACLSLRTVFAPVDLSPSIKPDSLRFISYNHIFSVVSGILGSGALSGSFIPLDFFAGIGLYKLIFVSGQYFNEAGHVLAAYFSGEKNIFTVSNLSGNRKISEWIKSLVPFLDFLSPLQTPHIELPEHSLNDREDQFIRYGGFWLGTILHGIFTAFLILAGAVFLITFISTPMVFIFLGILFVSFVHSIVENAKSDLGSFFKKGLFFCGNFGFYVSSSMPFKSFSEWLQKVISITEVRGKQAGGLVFNSESFFKLIKVINTKRSFLNNKLPSKLFNSRIKSLMKKEGAIFQGHVRYGTSSPPSLPATHPHVYSSQSQGVWRKVGDQWVKQKYLLKNPITHNGDFDRFDYSKQFHFAKDRSSYGVGDVHAWLNKAVAKNNSPGDSVNISGMIDLFHTEGMWSPSIRLAFYEILALGDYDHPKPVEIKAFADTFERIFSECLRQDLSPEVLREKITGEITNQLECKREILPEDKKIFIQKAVDHFFDNNLEKAVSLFAEGAVGTFALSVSSTHPNKKMILYAKGQPLVLGLSEDNKTIGWFSEAAATKLKDSQTEKLYFTRRIPLDEVAGEIYSISCSPESGLLELHMLKNDSDENLRIFTYPEIEKMGKVEALENNPLITPLSDFGKSDLVEKDIEETQTVLYDVSLSFKESSDFNFRSAEYFSSLIAERIKENMTDQEMDIVIIGEETSLFHADNMASSLSLLLGNSLKIHSLSSNDILESRTDVEEETVYFQKDKGINGKIGSHTIVLCISQSGQTFSSAMAMNLLSRITEKSFVLTGEVDSQMGRTIGQKYSKNSVFSNRIFTNKTGYRPAETSTISSLATHFSLNEILLHTAEKISGDPSLSYKIHIHKESLEVMKSINSRNLKENADPLFNPLSKIRSAIVKEGQKWADYITEGGVSWLVVKLTVFGCVGLGVFPAYVLAAFFILAFIKESLAFIKTLSSAKDSPKSVLSQFKRFMGVFGATIVFAGLSFALASPLVIPFFSLTINPWISAVIYAFISEIFIIALRFIQGRPLLDRMYGSKTFVLSDTPHTNKLLHSLVTKLFSSSYELTSLNIQSAKPNSMPHYYGHLVTRGLLVWIGMVRPSPFLHNKKWARDMNINQILGIRSMKGSAHVISFGHDKRRPSDENHFHYDLNGMAYTSIMDRACAELVKEFNLDTEKENALKMITCDHELGLMYNEWSSLDKMAEVIADHLRFEGNLKAIFQARMKDFLNQEYVLENLVEARYDSIKRYMAGMIFFDSMAKKVSRDSAFGKIFKYLRWVSHNGTRTQTTASPFPASHVLNLVHALDLVKERRAPVIEISSLPDSALTMESLPLKKKNRKPIYPEKILKPANELKNWVFPQDIQQRLDMIYEEHVVRTEKPAKNWEGIFEKIKKDLLYLESNKMLREKMKMSLCLRIAIVPKYRQSLLKYLENQPELRMKLIHQIDKITEMEEKMLESAEKEGESEELILYELKKVYDHQKTEMNSDYKTIHRMYRYLRSFDPDQSPDFISKEILKEFKDRRLKLKENWKGYFYYFVMKNNAFNTVSQLLNNQQSDHYFQRAA